MHMYNIFSQLQMNKHLLLLEINIELLTSTCNFNLYANVKQQWVVLEDMVVSLTWVLMP